MTYGDSLSTNYGELHIAPIAPSNQADFASDSLSVSGQEQGILDEIVPELQADIQGMFKKLFSNLTEHPRKPLLLMLESDHTVEGYAKEMGRSRASVERYQKQIRDEINKLTD